MRKYTGHNETWLTDEMNRALQAKTHLKRCFIFWCFFVIAIFLNKEQTAEDAFGFKNY